MIQTTWHTVQSVLGKELDHWTPIERGEFGDHASVRLELSKVKDDLRRKETALSAFRAGAANAQPFPGLPSIPEITSLEAFRAIPGILFKDTPGNETLTLDAFKMSIVRDEQVFADILRFLVQREEQFENRKQFDIRKVHFNSHVSLIIDPNIFLIQNRSTRSCVSLVLLVSKTVYNWKVGGQVCSFCRFVGTGKSHVLDYLENKLKSIELTGKDSVIVITHAMTKLMLYKDLSPEKALFYTRVKEMLRDSVFVSITLNSETPFRLREPLEYVLSSRILYTYVCAYFSITVHAFNFFVQILCSKGCHGLWFISAVFPLLLSKRTCHSSRSFGQEIRLHCRGWAYKSLFWLAESGSLWPWSTWRAGQWRNDSDGQIKRESCQFCVQLSREFASGWYPELFWAALQGKMYTNPKLWCVSHTLKK